MSSVFRKATERDISLIREIAQKTWFTTYEPILGLEQPKYMFDIIYSEKGLAQQMSDGQVFILQIINNEIIAFASFSIKDQENKSIYKLNKLYLNPDFQGNGYGKKLLDEVEKQVRNLGGTILDLNVNRYNKAVFFYEKLGFKVLLEEDIPIGEYWMNDFVMRKELF